MRKVCTMKQMMFILMAIFVAGSVSAQQRKGGKTPPKPGQYLRIADVTDIKSDNAYTVETPQQGTIKTTVARNESWKKQKTDVRGWHCFEVAYDVANIAADDVGKPVPVFVLPEVTVRVAALYDMSKSRQATMAVDRMKKAKRPAIGIDDIKTKYILLTRDFTYVNISANLQHYAAIMVPPTFAIAYGYPICLSFEILVNGERQGEIVTKLAPNATVDGKPLKGLVEQKGAKGDAVPTAWWDEILTKSESVARREGILRDRSETPFALADADYYDMLKLRAN